MVVFERLEAVAAIEHRRKFAARAAFAPIANPRIFGTVARDVAQLMIEAFLCADEVGRALAQTFARHRTARVPGVGRGLRGVAQVERHHLKRHDLEVSGAGQTSTSALKGIFQPPRRESLKR
jgi:hypothetical protein